MINLNFSTINIINSSQNIDSSVPIINDTYMGLLSAVNNLQFYYDNNIKPIVDFYNQYYSQLNDTLTLTQNYSANWNDLQTTVETNSSKWLKPFTIFYPTLIQDSVSQNDINNIITWLNEYFPIVNTDGSLNFVQNQKIIVSCYLYTYDINNKISLKDIAYSYSKCSTNNGNIYAHCQTIVTGGWIQCLQGAYFCDETINCYPKLNVKCWYGEPYIYDVGKYGILMPPDNPPAQTDKQNFAAYVSSKQNVRGQILADISMNFLNRKEIGIEGLNFIVNNCEWSHAGDINFLPTPTPTVTPTHTPTPTITPTPTKTPTPTPSHKK